MAAISLGWEGGGPGIKSRKEKSWGKTATHDIRVSKGERKEGVTPAPVIHFILDNRVKWFKTIKTKKTLGGSCGGCCRRVKNKNRVSLRG